MFIRNGRLRLKCDDTHTKTRFLLSAKRTSPFKSAGASVQSTTGSRGVRISGSNGSNAGYTMFRGSVKSTGYLLHSPVSPSIPLPCVTECHHISTGLHAISTAIMVPTFRRRVKSPNSVSSSPRRVSVGPRRMRNYAYPKRR
jgi:hypothetical protein